MASISITIQENSLFTVIGPLFWCDILKVRLWFHWNINYNDFHHLGKSQICAEVCWHLRVSEKVHCVICLSLDTEFINVCTSTSFAANKENILLRVQTFGPHVDIWYLDEMMRVKERMETRHLEFILYFTFYISYMMKEMLFVGAKRL